MPRPNILQIFVDQQRFDTIAALGNPHIRTPNLDRLCNEGVAFTDAYTPCPVCAPARISMAHGLNPSRTGCYENAFLADKLKVEGRPTFMQRLADAGYRTHATGKYHFIPDRWGGHGFQTREYQEGGYGDDHNDYARWLDEQGLPYIGQPGGEAQAMYYIPQLSPVPAEYTPSAWVGDRTIRFLQEEGTGSKPWFCYAGMIDPHPPFAPPYPWHALYPPHTMTPPFVPPEVEQFYTYPMRVQNRYKAIDSGINENLLRCAKAYYYATISWIDYQVGRILDALESIGKLDTTLVLFGSDHGEFMGDYHCYGKRSWLDPAARVPFIARLPGVFEGGRRCGKPVSLVDIAPTCLAAADVEWEDDAFDGVDLAALERGDRHRDAVFGQHSYIERVDIGRNRRNPVFPDPVEGTAARASYCAITEDWKYFYSAPDDMEFLFDRRRDPRESSNLAGLTITDPQCSVMRDLVMEELRRWGDTAGLEGNRWRQFPRCDVSPNPAAGQIAQGTTYRPKDKPRVPEVYWD